MGHGVHAHTQPEMQVFLILTYRKCSVSVPDVGLMLSVAVSDSLL